MHLVLNGKADSSQVLKGTLVLRFHILGPHPAGNVGVHIHHIDPVNKEK